MRIITGADHGKHSTTVQNTTIPLGESMGKTCPSFRNDANSKNTLENLKQIQRKRAANAKMCCCDVPNGYKYMCKAKKKKRKPYASASFSTPAVSLLLLLACCINGD